MSRVHVHSEASIHAVSESTCMGGSLSKATARYTPPRSLSPAVGGLGRGPTTAPMLPSCAMANAHPSLGASGRTVSTTRPSSTSPFPSTAEQTFPIRRAVATPPPQPVTMSSPYCGRRRMSVPPPPRVGETLQPAAYYVPKYEQGVNRTAPSTLSLNTTAAALSQARPSSTLTVVPQQQQQQLLPQSASTISSISRPGSTTQQDLTHPPGYMQNSRASFSDLPPLEYMDLSTVNHSQRQDSSRSRDGSRNGGILDGSAGGQDILDEKDGEKSVWETALAWAETVGEKVGEKVVEGEEQAWKRISGRG